MALDVEGNTERNGVAHQSVVITNHSTYLILIVSLFVPFNSYSFKLVFLVLKFTF